MRDITPALTTWPHDFQVLELGTSLSLSGRLCSSSEWVMDLYMLCSTSICVCASLCPVSLCKSAPKSPIMHSKQQTPLIIRSLTWWLSVEHQCKWICSLRRLTGCASEVQYNSHSPIHKSTAGCPVRIL